MKNYSPAYPLEYFWPITELLDENANIKSIFRKCNNAICDTTTTVHPNIFDHRKERLTHTVKSSVNTHAYTHNAITHKTHPSPTLYDLSSTPKLISFKLIA